MDADRNIYTAGSFYRIADFDSGAEVFNLVSSGDYDIFVSKLDSTGNFAWARRMGKAKGEDVQALANDLAGNIYATGNFHETVDFDPGTGNCNLTSAGEYDNFVLALDNAGNFIWAKCVGGPSGEDVNAIAVDAAGDIYTTGHFNGVADFDPGTGVFNLTSVGLSDVFVSKLSPDAQLP